MREHAHRIGYALVAALATLGLAIASALVGAAAWATQVLIVPGTGTPNPATSNNYQQNAVQYYVGPAGGCAGQECKYTPVPYTAQFWPIPLAGWGGLQGAKWDDSVASGVTSLNQVYGATDKSDPIVIFGYSQGATVVSQVKQQMRDGDGVPGNVSFVLIGNASRPNGGLFSRPSVLGHIPILDVTFRPGTPTDTSATVNTTDVAFQYDGVADFPKYPVNLLATANALAGFWYVHGEMLAPKGNDAPGSTPVGYTPEEVQTAVKNATDNCSAATYCQVSGDTRYITLPAKILPIMLPLLDLGAATGTTAFIKPVIDLVSPVARVLIETGYDRRDYGAATPFGAIPTIDPLRTGTDLIGAAVQGVTDAVTGKGDASDYLNWKASLPAPPAATPAPSAATPEPFAAKNDPEPATAPGPDHAESATPPATPPAAAPEIVADSPTVTQAPVAEPNPATPTPATEPSPAAEPAPQGAVTALTPSAPHATEGTESQPASTGLSPAA